MAWEAVDEPLPAWRRNRLLRNTELLRRLGWTVALALLIRCGCFIPLPDIARTAAPSAAGAARLDQCRLQLAAQTGHCIQHIASTIVKRLECMS